MNGQVIKQSNTLPTFYHVYVNIYISNNHANFPDVYIHTLPHLHFKSYYISSIPYKLPSYAY